MRPGPGPYLGGLRHQTERRLRKRHAVVGQPTHPLLRTGTDKLPILNNLAQPGPRGQTQPQPHSQEGLNTPSVWRSARLQAAAKVDEPSMTLLTIPIFCPMVMSLDFGMPEEIVAIWFRFMVLMTVGFGLLTPPVGLNVYAVNGLARDVRILESYRSVMPFLISDMLRTLLLFFPPISLWLMQYLN